MEHSFNPLIETLFSDVYKDDERIEPEDKIRYFSLIKFSLKLVKKLKLKFR